MFIVLEGADGAGKGVQGQMLQEALKKAGCKVWATREPTDGVHGQRIRRILAKEELPMPAATEFQELFVLDRAEHVAEVQQRMNDGWVVLCDRYYYSTLAYGAVGGADVADLASANASFPVPDVAIWLNIDPDIARTRMEQRGAMDEHDGNLESQRKLQGAYRDLIETRPELVEVDASGTPEEVHARVWGVVSAKLPVGAA